MPVEPMRMFQGLTALAEQAEMLAGPLLHVKRVSICLYVQHASQAVGWMDRWVVPTFLFLPKEGK